ncbi:vanadium-dependent haloperoxidase [Flavihumibacter rivuli]|uniref:vanadium-dependent haloperoxidase n=1 Tax=Flavihumibacter rivuli TaxID=2838156 RepID=UPI001BDE1351|nr:vanadium-dependent haloperoxidase [Flavihumibacter rivuli]ULQ55891.1 vanadium-dependent haloperoxidase [Flavihumibacter rivuli]
MKRIHFWTILAISFIAFQCERSIETEPMTAQLQKGHLEQTKTFSSTVASSWMNLEVELMKAAPTAVGNAAFSRHFAYAGVALYESVVPGMPAYRSLQGQLNGLENLPTTKPGFAYHWGASANASLAAIMRRFFAYLPSDKLALIGALEDQWSEEFAKETEAATIERSEKFGKEVAEKIISWSEKDGYDQVNTPIIAPEDRVGPGYWTPPATPSVQSLPNWGGIRRMVSSSGEGAELLPPPYYSTMPGSDFYNMVKEVYDLSPAIGSPERAMAFYWRDVPGTTTPGHYISILKQVVEQDKVDLGRAALAFAMAGIMVFDASISTWQSKYDYWLLRPITYIQQVLGYTTWTPTLGTPPHPEYPSAHSSLSAANAEALTVVFGDNHPFTDHTFDYLYNSAVDPLLFKSRTYPNFRAIAKEAGLSRLYAGIHYRNSIEQGLKQGKVVAENILRTIKFKK